MKNKKPHFALLRYKHLMEHEKHYNNLCLKINSNKPLNKKELFYLLRHALNNIDFNYFDITKGNYFITKENYDNVKLKKNDFEKVGYLINELLKL